MRTRVLAVDCDNTIIEQIAAYLGFLNRYYRANICLGDIPDRNIMGRYGISAEELYQREEEFLRSETGRHLPLCVGVLEALPRLRKKYDLYVVMVTARLEDLRDITQEMADRHFPPGTFEEIIFTGRRGAKSVRKTEILPAGAILIDDHPGHVRSQGGILFGDYPWQHDCGDLIRARDWFRVEEILPGLLPP